MCVKGLAPFSVYLSFFYFLALFLPSMEELESSEEDDFEEDESLSSEEDEDNSEESDYSISVFSIFSIGGASLISFFSYSGTLYLEAGIANTSTCLVSTVGSLSWNIFNFSSYYFFMWYF